MSFKSLSRQNEIADRLHQSLVRGRLAHAYLFIGPRGAGKEELARTLAKALNCPKLNDDSCDKCDTCRRIEEATHPDIYWVRPESKSRRITVAQIREFEKAVNLKASEAETKVGIIVDADCMGEEASNAFLKTLEEPPAQTILVLLTTAPARLLPTILSRCLKLSLGATDRSTVSPYEAKLLPLLADFAANRSERVPAAYRLLADITAILKDVREEIRQRIEADENLDRYEELEAKTRDRLEDQMTARIEGEYRAAREQVMEEIYRWFGDLLLCVLGADKRLLSHPKSLAALQAAAEGVTYEQASAWLDACEQVRDSLQRNVPESLAFEVGLLRMSR